MTAEHDPGRTPPPEGFSERPGSLAGRLLLRLESEDALREGLAEPQSLREIADMFSETSAEGTTVSRQALRKWLIMAVAYHGAPLLGVPEVELTGEHFQQAFSETETPLPPESVLLLNQNLACRLDAGALRDLLTSAGQIKEKKGTYEKAVAAMNSLKEICLSPHQITELIGAESPVIKHTLLKTTREIGELILSGELPLGHYPLFLARAIGIPKGYFQNNLIKDWQEILISKRAVTTRTKLKREKVYGYQPLVSNLRAANLTVANRHTKAVALTLPGLGVAVEIDQKNDGTSYYGISPEEAKKLSRLLEDTKTKVEIARLATWGFNLEQYLNRQEHFPRVTVSEAIKLAGGPTVSTKDRVERAIDILRLRGVETEKVSFGKRIITYISIQDLEEAVEIIRQTENRRPERVF